MDWPLPKDPDDYCDYQFDWQYRLEDSETIATSAFTATGSITLDNESVDGGVTTVWVSGGVAGERCTITNRVTTSEGRQYDQTATLRIRER